MKQVWMINQYAITPNFNGGTRHYSLSKRLLALGYQVTIFASKSQRLSSEAFAASRPIEQESSDGVNFVWIKLPRYEGNSVFRIINMLAFAFIMLKKTTIQNQPKPDYVYGSSPHLFGALAALLVAWRHRVPFILEIRDLWPQTFLDLGAFSRFHPYVLGCLAIEKILYRYADKIVTLLPGSQDHIAAKGGDRSKMVWIPNGIDFDVFNHTPPAENATNSQFRCVYGGAHGLANSLSVILSAAEILQREGLLLEFHFYGEGPEKPKLMRLASEKKMKTVFFHSGLPKTEIYGVYKSADLLLESKADTELYKWGISFNKMYDYLASGRPIVMAVKSPYNPVTEGRVGEVVRPEDPAAMAAAIRKIYELSPAERLAMGQRGQELVRKNYDFDILVKRLSTILHTP